MAGRRLPPTPPRPTGTEHEPRSSHRSTSAATHSRAVSPADAVTTPGRRSGLPHERGPGDGRGVTHLSGTHLLLLLSVVPAKVPGRPAALPLRNSTHPDGRAGHTGARGGGVRLPDAPGGGQRPA